MYVEYFGFGFIVWVGFLVQNLSDLFQAVLNSPLAEFIKDLPQALLKQYEFEEPVIRRGEQMMYSPFLRV